MTRDTLRVGQHVLINGKVVGVVRRVARVKSKYFDGEYVVEFFRDPTWCVAAQYVAFLDELEPITEQEYFVRKLKEGGKIIDPHDH